MYNNILPDNIYRQMAATIRVLAMDAVEKAKSGHPGMPMGMADVAAILFSEFLKFCPEKPDWPDRDRFVLSAGHGSMLLYALLYLTGYKDITIEDLKNFRQLHAKTGGHPEYSHISGIETTTGPLGQGFANAVGMAIAEQMMAARFGQVIDHFTYVIAGDGCLMEGISYEAASLAGHLKLGKLIVLFDDNKISIDGPTSLAVSENQLARFAAANWHVQSIDGHNFSEIREAIKAAKQSPLPSLIACRTTIAYGAPTKAGKSSSHGSPLGANEIEGARKNLNWPYPPFEIPEELLSTWRDIGRKGQEIYNNWMQLAIQLPAELKHEFERTQAKILPEKLDAVISNLKKAITDNPVAEATRKSSGKVLSALMPIMPELIGGSADLSGSNETKTLAMQPITKEDFSGQYIYYGVREHAMAAVMNGIALHKGFVPYGGTFLVFSDYCRPAIRLSAIMKQQVVYVMTHDSIGLGEDGTTHQPIEHLASLRAMPDLFVYRPADAVETAECWESILKKQNAPAVLALSRQELPIIRTQYTQENLCNRGAYIISESQGEIKVTIFATGSEVCIAIEAQKQLHTQNIGVRVISMPCLELFESQDSQYKRSLCNNNSLKVAVEAACGYGWERYIGQDGLFIGVNSFGTSGKIEDLYQYYGITAEAIVEQVLTKLGKK